MSDPTGWISLGIGVAQIIQGAIASGGNGVFVDADVTTYHVGDYPARGEELTQEILSIEIEAGFAAGFTNGFVNPCKAVVSMTGQFEQGSKNPPTLANVRLWCSDQGGNWGTADSESEMHFKADALPTPVGTPQDPHLQYQCRLELKVEDGDNVIMHFKLDVDQHGQVYATTPHFEYGECETHPWAHGLFVRYVPPQHGDLGD